MSTSFSGPICCRPLSLGHADWELVAFWSMRRISLTMMANDGGSSWSVSTALEIWQARSSLRSTASTSGIVGLRTPDMAASGAKIFVVEGKARRQPCVGRCSYTASVANVWCSQGRGWEVRSLEKAHLLPPWGSAAAEHSNKHVMVAHGDCGGLDYMQSSAAPCKLTLSKSVVITGKARAGDLRGRTTFNFTFSIVYPDVWVLCRNEWA